MDRKKLKAGFKEARRITKHFAKTFYLASLFLPKAKKYASYAIYAICRLSDEAVDNATNSDPEQNLQKLEKMIAGAYTENINDTPLLTAFRHTVNTYQIPHAYFLTLLQGMRMDLVIKRYADFPALYKYCYRAAGVVGQIMLKIFGYKDKSAETHAIELGIAMQLTNILRDISEDLTRGRIYLPQDELMRFGVSEQQLTDKQNNAALKNLLRFQIQRCDKLYLDSLAGIKLINNRRARFVVLAMQENYRLILEKIRNNNYDVFSRRAQVGTTHKIIAVIKILLKGSYL